MRFAPSVRPRTPMMLEADWQRKVIDTARLFNWRLAHFRPARTAKGWRTAFEGDAGFPDLVLVRPPRIIFAELKRESAKPNVDQLLWLADLASSGVESYVWSPAQWDEVYLTLAREKVLPLKGRTKG